VRSVDPLHRATISAPIAPRAARHSPSITACRARRARVAPSESRSAVSRARARPRRSRRFATLAQAISSTRIDTAASHSATRASAPRSGPRATTNGPANAFALANVDS
jgi:hypothetical protein